MQYELLIFDADETLFDFKKSQAYALEESVKHYAIDFPYDMLRKTYERINTHIWHEFEKGQIDVAKLKVARFERLFEEIGAAVSASDFAGTYQANLASASFIYSGVKPLLERLYEDYRLAIITNGLYSVQKKRISESEVSMYFDEIIISEEVGLVKPDPKIFEFALKRLGHANKETALMIGDNLKSDILGGIKSGIDTCWLNPKGLANETDIRPTFELQSVTELESIL